MIELTREDFHLLEEKYGLPLYVFNRDEFILNYKELENTFRSIYPNYHICYSYKTNYTPAICSLVKSLGGYAEVVSDMEYELAKRLGYAANEIVYNGPYKGEALVEHLLAGGINNIDRTEEVDYICSIATHHPGVSIKTGIRVNFDIDAGYTSRFGIDKDCLGPVISKLKKSGVIVNGLHCHMSRARGLEPWRLRAETMLSIIDKYSLFDLDYISLGSGMAGHMDYELKSQFSEVPTYEEYGQVAIKLFAQYYKTERKKPILFTEPGTTLVSKYVDYLAKVDGVKIIRNNPFILCNCSFQNLGETSQMKKLPMRILSNGVNRKWIDNASFVGYTCLEQDILYKGYSGYIGIGDYVEFGNVGGYSLVEKPPFIQPNCAMISLDHNGTKIIKRRETWNDIFATFDI